MSLIMYFNFAGQTDKCWLLIFFAFSRHVLLCVVLLLFQLLAMIQYMYIRSMKKTTNRPDKLDRKRLNDSPSSTC